MKNKHNIFGLILSILISTLFMTSCKDEIVLSEGNEETLHTVKMTLNGSFIDYDGTSTRASSREWKNGDTLYLGFYTSNGLVNGKAVYDDSNTGGWIVSYYGTLDKNSEMKVRVNFLDNPTLRIEDNIIYLTPTTPIYYSYKEGTAIYTPNGELSITVLLQPLGNRIRFKGNPGENILVGGMLFHDYFNLDDNTYYSASDNFYYLKITESCYTDYIYCSWWKGIFEDENKIKINKQEDDGWKYLYTLDCTEDMLADGKSGWLNVPTPTNLNGWTIKQVSGEDNGCLWVDLGLPSGNKWATDNVGADIALWQEDEKESNVFGKELYWGQTSADKGYTICVDIQGSDYHDTAKWYFKGSWIMPAKADYEELIRYCKLKVVNNAYGSINTIEVRGNTGELINFPYDKNNSETAYWTSTPVTRNSPELTGNAYAFIIDSFGNYKLTEYITHYPALVNIGSADSNKYQSAYLRAINQVFEPTGITLSHDIFNMLKGEIRRLTPTIIPENATDKTVRWTIADESVATVDMYGVVMAKGWGTTEVSAYTSNNLSATCQIVVTPKIDD